MDPIRRGVFHGESHSINILQDVAEEWETLNQNIPPSALWTRMRAALDLLIASTSNTYGISGFIHNFGVAIVISLLDLFVSNSRGLHGLIRDSFTAQNFFRYHQREFPFPINVHNALEAVRQNALAHMNHWFAQGIRVRADVAAFALPVDELPRSIRLLMDTILDNLTEEKNITLIDIDATDITCKVRSNFQHVEAGTRLSLSTPS